MAELISIRVFVFFVAFFLLRAVMLALMPGAKRGHALILLGASTLIAFLVGALVLDDPLGDTLLAWLVIYAIIAALWFARWKGQEYERTRRQAPVRSQAELDPDEVDARRRERE